MTLRFLLDTSAVSQDLRPQPAPGIEAGLDAHDGQLAIAAPAWHELRFGFERLPPSRRRRPIESYLAEAASWLPVLPYGERAATSACGQSHAAFERRCIPPERAPPLRSGALFDAHRSKYTRYSSLARRPHRENWVSRAPPPPGELGHSRCSHDFIHRLTWHARERARLTRLGKTPPFVDGQIAAVAWANDLALVTTNPTDFLEFDGLRLRAW